MVLNLTGPLLCPVSLRAPFSVHCCSPCIYINDIPVDIDSQIRLFADDCVCYRKIRTVEDTLKLQKDIDLLGSWAGKWGLRFQPVKCNMMQLTNRRITKIEASYTLEGKVLKNVDSIKYLGVTITNNLKWNTHITNICTKANRTLGFLRRRKCDWHFDQLKWESLKKRGTDNLFILLYKCLKGKASIPYK